MRRQGWHPETNGRDEDQRRPCTPDDVYLTVQRLHAAGRLTLQHLLALRDGGEIGRAPARPIIAERWAEAMQVIKPALAARGIVGAPLADA